MQSNTLPTNHVSAQLELFAQGCYPRAWEDSPTIGLPPHTEHHTVNASGGAIRFEVTSVARHAFSECVRPLTSFITVL